MTTSLSSAHLRAHQGDIDRYHSAVGRSAAGRFGPTWWGIFDEHVQLGDQSTLVDLGAGTGAFLAMVRERQARMRLIGVEMQAKMAASARESATSCGAEIIEADLGEELPLADGTADVVTAVMVFHELLYPPQLLSEAMRLLKPGGKLFLYDWVKRPLESYLRDMDRELTPAALQHYREHCLFSAPDLTFLAKRAGFEICEVVHRRGGNFALVVAEVPAD